MATAGVSFTGQVALLTGAGIGSINIELAKALLQGGATVIVTLFVRHAQRQLRRTGPHRILGRRYVHPYAGGRMAKQNHIRRQHHLFLRCRGQPA